MMILRHFLDEITVKDHKAKPLKKNENAQVKADFK